MIIKSAGGVLFDKQGKRVYLIHKKERNEWLLPKGHIEEGEGIVDAAAREIAEETGYSRLVVYGPEPVNIIIYQFEEKGKKQEKRVYFFLARLLSEDQVITKQMVKEGLSGDWFSFDKALKKASHKEVKETLLKAYERTK